MKKILLAVLAVLVFAAPAFADWSVTVTWTRSVGPNLDYEEVLYDGAMKCTVQETETTTCNFVLTELGGDVVIRSYNDQGAYADTAAVAVSDVPAPATGVNVTVTYVAP